MKYKILIDDPGPDELIAEFSEQYLEEEYQ